MALPMPLVPPVISEVRPFRNSFGLNVFTLTITCRSKRCVRPTTFLIAFLINFLILMTSERYYLRIHQYTLYIKQQDGFGFYIFLYVFIDLPSSQTIILPDKQLAASETIKLATSATSSGKYKRLLLFMS